MCTATADRNRLPGTSDRRSEASVRGQLESGKAVPLPQPERAPLEQPLRRLSIDVGDLVADIEINVMDDALKEPCQRQQPRRPFPPAPHFTHATPRTGHTELVKRRAQMFSGGIQVDLEVQARSSRPRLDLSQSVLRRWIHVLAFPGARPLRQPNERIGVRSEE